MAVNSKDSGTSLAVQWLGLHASTARGMGSIPGRGTKILHATPRPKKKKKNKDSGAWLPWFKLQLC